MGEPFIAEIRAFTFGYAPPGWAPCDGRTLQVRDNAPLFSILGDRFGGDGVRTFGLPDLRGAVAVHPQAPDGRGTTTGSATVTLGVAQMPQHTHPLLATTAPATTNDPKNNVYAQGSQAQANQRKPLQAYSTSDPFVAMAATAAKPVGNGKPHNNLMPYVALNYCIALTGCFPPRS